MVKNVKQHQSGPRARKYSPRGLQNAFGVSHRDIVPQSRKFTALNQCSIENTNGEYAFGIAQFSGFPQPTNSLGLSLNSHVGDYEEYRIRRIRVRAVPGKGMSNDRRIQAIIVSRVDTGFVDTNITWANMQSLVNCENSVIKTFAASTNILVADVKPVCFQGTTASASQIPTLPNKDQWYRLKDCYNHVWRAGVVGLLIPDNNLQPNEVRLNLILEVDVDFRGRIQSASQYTSSSLLSAQPVKSMSTTNNNNTFNFST